MNYGAVVFFIVTGLVFIIGGYQHIRTKKSNFRIGNQFQKERIGFSGNLAVLHGAFYIIIGVFAFVWATSGIMEISQADWNWILLGCFVLHLLFFMSVLILFAARSISDRNLKQSQHKTKKQFSLLSQSNYDKNEKGIYANISSKFVACCEFGIIDLYLCNVLGGFVSIRVICQILCIWLWWTLCTSAAYLLALQPIMISQQKLPHLLLMGQF